MKEIEKSAQKYANGLVSRLGEGPLEFSLDLLGKALQSAYKQGWVDGELEMLKTVHGIKEKTNDEIG